MTFLSDFFVLVGALFFSMFFFSSPPDRFFASKAVQVRTGLYQGFFGMIIVFLSNFADQAPYMDLRMLPVVTAAYFGGMRASMIAAALIAGIPIIVGLIESSILVSVLTLALGGFAGWTAKKLQHFWRLWFVNIGAAVVICTLILGMYTGISETTSVDFFYMAAALVVGGCFVAGCIYFLKNAYDNHFLNKRLYNLIHTFQHTHQIDDIYEKTLRELSDFFICQSGNIVVIENNKYLLVGEFVDGEYRKIGKYIDLKEIEALEQAVQGQSSLYPDWTSRKPNGTMDGLAFSNGTLSSVHVPIKHKNQVIALLSLASTRVGQFNRQKMIFVENVVPSISMALALFESEARFSSIMESSRDAIIVADRDLNVLLWNPGAVQVFGYTEEEALGKHITQLVPLRYRNIYLKYIEKRYSFYSPQQSDDKQRMEIMVLRKDQSVIPIELTFSNWEVGGKRYYSSIIRDISLRKRYEEQIVSLKSELENTLHYQHGITLKYKKIDGQFVYTLAEGQMLRELSLTPQQVAGQPIQTVLPEALIAFLTEKYEQAWHGEVVECEYSYNTRAYYSTLNPVLKNGLVVEVVVSISNNTQRKLTEQKLIEANKRLELLSNIDGLTLLHNRRSFDRQLEQCCENSRVQEQPMALILMDIDSFKAYNDTYGHLEGDACLKSVSSFLYEQAEKRGYFAARYGGEEFACILPGADEAAATAFAEAVRSGVESMQIPNKNAIAAPFVSVSIGITCISHMEAIECPALVHRADQALYKAKRNGRNRYYI